MSKNPLKRSLGHDGREEKTKRMRVEAVELPVEPQIREWVAPEVRLRDGKPKDDEKNGSLEWKLINNDGKRDNLKLLVDLKNVIVRCLPNMTSKYTTRLVFDLSHRSLVGVRLGRVIGGITFLCFDRPNMTKFIEVVFCAISPDQQLGGYGSRVMSHLKTWGQKNGFYHLLTYADDSAIGYFQRQGFSKEIGLSEKEWNIGFLKTYDSATLMHCHIDQNINYLEIAAEIRQQNHAFQNKLRELTGQHLIYPGVDNFHQGAVLLNLDNLEGLKQSGWDSSKFLELTSPETQRIIYEQNKHLLDQIKSDTEVFWPFEGPVTEIFQTVDPLHYQSIVKDPIDLRTIEQNLNRGFYITHQMFVADLHRMVENCMAYNAKKTRFHALAEKLRTRYLQPYTGMAQTGSDLDVQYEAT